MDWVFFPRTKSMPAFLRDSIKAFEKKEEQINSLKNKAIGSNFYSKYVIEIVRPNLEKLKYEFENSDRKDKQVRLPVIFSNQSKEEMSFKVDAYNKYSNTIFLRFFLNTRQLRIIK